MPRWSIKYTTTLELSLAQALHANDAHSLSACTHIDGHTGCPIPISRSGGEA